MPDQVGPYEIVCDAPPYRIVRGCAELGFEQPLDVRWLRLDRVLGSRDSATSFLTTQAWTEAIGFTRQGERRCSCGQPLPALDRCTFILRSGTQFDYLVGQCSRCKTVYWQQV
jgi:hypothetical protein